MNKMKKNYSVFHLIIVIFITYNNKKKILFFFCDLMNLF